jgi:hypothetical protein
MPHPKRPVRLDKRHRELLKKMPFGELLNLILPVLQQKAIDVVPHNPEIQQLLERLRYCAARYVAGTDSNPGDPMHAMLDELVTSDRVSHVASQISGAASSVSSASGLSLTRSQVSLGGGAKTKPGFVGALQVMSARLLLSLINRMAPAEAVEERGIVEQILALIHENNEAAIDEGGR